MAWSIVFYSDATGTAPAHAFLDDCPAKVAATFIAVLDAVRAAPPPAFSGGGKWEAMHGTMGGYYEIRVTGPGRRHYRLFCLLENGTPKELAERGFEQPQIVVINGMVKPNAPCSTTVTTRSTSARSGRTTSPSCRVRSPDRTARCARPAAHTPRGRRAIRPSSVRSKSVGYLLTRALICEEVIGEPSFFT